MWTSPDKWWALAFALAAYCRPRLRLANPGLVTEAVPGFWNVYNALPSPSPAGQAKIPQDAAPKGRRIRAS